MCRVSTDEQAKGYSLDVQHEQLVRYCQRNNIEIIKECVCIPYCLTYFVSTKRKQKAIKMP